MWDAGNDFRGFHIRFRDVALPLLHRAPGVLLYSSILLVCHKCHVHVMFVACPVTLSYRKLQIVQSLPDHYGHQTLFSQGSSSSSFALLLSSGFHFSIFLTKFKNSAFSSPSSRFSASSKVLFGTSAAPLHLPVAKRVNKNSVNSTNRTQWQTHRSRQTNSVRDTLLCAQEIPSEVVRAGRSYARGDRCCPAYPLVLQWCGTNFRSQAGPRSTRHLSWFIVA